MRIRTHLAAILGIAAILPSIWRGLVWLFDWEVRIETMAEKLHQYGGLGGVMERLINPPPWLALIAVPIGLILIWWDVRWRGADGIIQATAPLPVHREHHVHQGKIVIGTGHPFETVAPAGVNRRRTVRVKIENRSGAEISNGALQLLSLDPPSKNHRDLLIKGGITIGPRGHAFVDIAFYDEGTSEAKVGSWMGLCLPPLPGGYVYGPLPGQLPLIPHTFHLNFSSLEGDSLDDVYCRLRVDQSHVLRLEDWGDSAKIIATEEQIVSADHNLRDMTMTECFHLLNSVSEYPAFEDSLHQGLFDGAVSAWGRRQLNSFDADERGPYHVIEKSFWLTGRLEWTTIGPSGTERATNKDEQDYTGIRFNSAQIGKLAAEIARAKPT